MASPACQSPPWAPYSLLSDVTVLLETHDSDVQDDTVSKGDDLQKHQNKFHLHKFPLFTKSRYFRRKFEDVDETCRHITVNLTSEIVPRVNPTFQTVLEYCYGVIPELTAETVMDVIFVAEQLGMTEEYSCNNLIKLCEDFIAEEVYSSREKSFLLLETLDELALDGGLREKICQACQEVIIEYAEELQNDKSDSAVGLIKALFERLSGLHPAVLEGILDGFRHSDFTFTYVGNSLAEENYSTVLGEKYFKISKSFNEADHHLAKRMKLKELNQCTILDFLVDALVFTANNKTYVKLAQFSVSYAITLLKYCCKLHSKYEALLRDYVGSILGSCSLQDLQALEFKTVVAIISKYVSDHTPSEEDNLSPSLPEESKSVSVGSLVDNYLFWAVKFYEHFPLSDVQTLVEILPDSFRESCDTLYDGIDSFLEKNPLTDTDERSRLCDHIDPFKLSETQTEKAIQNNRIPLQPGYFTTLYLAQSNEIKSQKKQLTDLQAEMENLRTDSEEKGVQLETMKAELEEKDDQIATLLEKIQDARSWHDCSDVASDLYRTVPLKPTAYRCLKRTTADRGLLITTNPGTTQPQVRGQDISVSPGDIVTASLNVDLKQGVFYTAFIDEYFNMVPNSRASYTVVGENKGTITFTVPFGITTVYPLIFCDSAQTVHEFEVKKFTITFPRVNRPKLYA